jgi:hypothetical protein
MSELRHAPKDLTPPLIQSYSSLDENCSSPTRDPPLSGPTLPSLQMKTYSSVRISLYVRFLSTRAREKEHNVAYLLKARTVEPWKQLLGNGSVTRNDSGIFGNWTWRVQPLLRNEWVKTFPRGVNAQKNGSIFGMRCFLLVPPRGQLSG